MTMTRSDRRDTKTRILDAAEILFARNGFKRTSIKALARRAHVNQAAVNYHFGSKQALVEKVIERRLAAINQKRMAMFRAIEDRLPPGGGRPDIQAVLRAFVEPVFAVAELEPKGRCFLLIEGRGLAEADEAIRNIFVSHFRPAYLRLAALMAKALPDLSEAQLHWRLHFVIGALAHALRICGGQSPGADVFPPAAASSTVVPQLVTFLAQGMTAPSPSADAPSYA